MSQMAFYFDGTRCTGCKTCEFACKDFNDLGLGMTFRKVLEATTGETKRDVNGCFTTNCVSYTISIACNHCDSPICMANCPQQAISKNEETGFVGIDSEKCIGCGACAQSCPYHAPVVDVDTKVSMKCHGCAERVALGMDPVCVEACPSRALSFGPVEEMEKLGDRANISPLPDAEKTKPNLFIKPSADAQPVGKIDVVNPIEVGLA